MPFALTILISACLLFQVQPLIARAILPWFGGSAAVWTACMLFFQIFLVAGYLYAWWLVRLAPRRQTLVHSLVLAASLVALPILPGPAWKPIAPENPTGHIMLLLAATVGLPYLLLATTSPLVQSWFARARPHASPYRLFALSNLGSLAGLILYPALIEPLMPLRWQGLAWSMTYTLYALLAMRLAWQARSLPTTKPLQHTAPSGSLAAQQATDAGTACGSAAADSSAIATLLCLALPACASVLLLAFTTHLTQNIAPIPFLWLLPLGLYLVSFILCFENRRWYDRRFYLPLLALGLAGVCLTLLPAQAHPGIGVLLPLHTATLLAACMVCHGELARLKPAPQALTRYYLMIAIGGALGGLLVGIVAPTLFDELLELPIGMVLVVIVTAGTVMIDTDRCKRAGADGSMTDVASAARLPPMPMGLRVVVSIACVIYAFGLATALWMIHTERTQDTIAAIRNFYGALRVDEDGWGEMRERRLTHGTITHGKQFIDPQRSRWPTTYYAEDSGVGLAIAAQRVAEHPINLGMVGLGAGTLAAYGHNGDHIQIYEINPLVRDLANRYFRYLAESAARIDFSMGDARLSMEREAARDFDVLAIDAFSSDSIPVHLLTAEAFSTWFRHLKPGGILAVHISNRYLDLEPVLAAAATHAGVAARVVESDGNNERAVYGSTWVLLSRTDAVFGLAPLARSARPLAPAHPVRLWTDDYSDLMSILK